MNRVNNKTLRKWCKERDTALSTLDLNEFKKFYKKWKLRGFYDRSIPKDDKVTEIAMYKCAYNAVNIPAEIRDKAEAWLVSRGYSTQLR